MVTSVDRDDLADGGAGHFAATARAIKRRLPECAVEVLTPDFKGDLDALAAVVDAPIDVFNHNTETVPRLYQLARPGGRYERCLSTPRRRESAAAGAADQDRADARSRRGDATRCSAVFADLREVGCDILTLGQYLQPTKQHLPIERYLTPAEFAELGAAARALGFRHVESGPLVRSSYHAWQHVE